MKLWFFVILFSLLLFTVYFYIHHPLGEKVIINGHTIQVDVAVTNDEKEKGLGDRESLAKDHGMLFVYDHEQKYQFWMKGMQFPLDFIWIRENTIVYLHRDVPAPAAPQDPPAVVIPKVSVDKILEVNAGTIDELNIH